MAFTIIIINNRKYLDLAHNITDLYDMVSTELFFTSSANSSISADLINKLRCLDFCGISHPE